jgi:hypothetical protein
VRPYVQWIMIVITAMLFTAVPSSRADDDQTAPYTIKLDRPAKKGDKGSYELSTAERITTTTRWDGYPKPVVTEKIYGGHLVAEMEVLEASDSGIPLVQSFLIRTCTTLKDQNEVELVPAGAKIVARANKEGTEYAVDGIPPEDSVRESLRSIITLPASSDPHPWDTLFGANMPRRIGDTWSMNVPAALKTSKQRGYVIKSEDLSGRAELVAVESCDGQTCLRIRATSHTKRLIGDESRSSDQYKLIDGSADSTAEWLLPVDPDKAKRQSSLSSTLRYVYEGRSQGRHYFMDQVTQSETVMKRLDVEAAATTTAATTRP